MTPASVKSWAPKRNTAAAAIPRNDAVRKRMQRTSRKKKDGRKSVKDEQPKTLRRDWRIDTLQRLNR